MSDATTPMMGLRKGAGKGGGGSVAFSAGNCDGQSAPQSGSQSGPQSGPETRARILEAARQIFSRFGNSATVRDICRNANANVAAINYHFGSKDGLQAALLGAIMQEQLARYPLDGGIPKGASAAERFHGFIIAFLHRTLLVPEGEAGSRLGGMLSEAFLHPLAEFEPYARLHRDEIMEYLLPLLTDVTEYYGARVEQAEVLDLMSRSVVSQLLVFHAYRSHQSAKGEVACFTPEELAKLARHISHFSLGGIKLITEQGRCEVTHSDIF